MAIRVIRVIRVIKVNRVIRVIRVHHLREAVVCEVDFTHQCQAQAQDGHVQRHGVQ
jgi:hypothetical protein